MKRTCTIMVFIFFILMSYSVSGGAVSSTNNQYAVISWNDLGMHCMDHDYSVFAILPPYNTLHSQLINRLTGRLINTGFILTYQATEDHQWFNQHNEL
jgi:hypothetical protein